MEEFGPYATYQAAVDAKARIRGEMPQDFTQIGETKMEILNLTPHPVNIINGEGVMTATFPVAGPAPRLAELVESLPAVDGLPVNKVSYSEEITNLPAPHKGVLLIVSRITAAAVTGREDILFPHGEVRDENGRILGVRALGRF